MHTMKSKKKRKAYMYLNDAIECHISRLMFDKRTMTSKAHLRALFQGYMFCMMSDGTLNWEEYEHIKNGIIEMLENRA